MKTPKLPLIGRHIMLRDWRLDDLAVWAPWMEPGHRWKDLDGPYYELPSPEERGQMVERKRAEIETGADPFPPRGLVIADRETDMFIGVVSWSWESEETRWPGVGIVIYDESRWDKGIGYEALGLWTDFLFRALPDVARLDLRTWSGNRGMMRLAEKLGYVEEARFRRARIVDGKYYDGLGYGILREEWESRHPHGFVL